MVFVLEKKLFSMIRTDSLTLNADVDVAGVFSDKERLVFTVSWCSSTALVQRPLCTEF